MLKKGEKMEILVVGIGNLLYWEVLLLDALLAEQRVKYESRYNVTNVDWVFDKNQLRKLETETLFLLLELKKFELKLVKC